jgi:ribose transport system permease protein
VIKKLLGLTLFLLVLYVLLLLANPGARSADNHLNLGKRIGLYGILSLGVGVLIISGGIDLSIGSVVSLCATLMAVLLIQRQWHPAAALASVLACGAGIGLLHGLLVTRARVQAFVVTLCGLFIYRGIARWLTNDGSVGLASGPLKGIESPLPPQVIADRVALLKQVLNPSGKLFELPLALVILLVLAALATVFLHYSVYGRYLYAIGSNEQAARYSGIAVDRYKILAYVLCSSLAAFFGVLFLLEFSTSQPSQTGNFLELYAIAGAVLGGCSLRGGEGSVIGILIGTAILWILPNFTNMWGVPKTLEYTVIGLALLLGAILDELLRRRGTRTKPA